MKRVYSPVGHDKLLLVSVIAFLTLAAAAQVPPAAIAVSNSPAPATTIVMPSVPAAPSAPPPPAPQIVRGPQERGMTQSYVSRDDYPDAARAVRAEGTVHFILTVGTDGRVIGCAITRSSGSGVLDLATCRIMRRRARYTPAMDSNGNPVVGTIEQQIVWESR